jgi:hypothetical protein
MDWLSTGRSRMDYSPLLNRIISETLEVFEQVKMKYEKGAKRKFYLERKC